MVYIGYTLALIIFSYLFLNNSNYQGIGFLLLSLLGQFYLQIIQRRSQGEVITSLLYYTTHFVIIVSFLNDQFYFSILQIAQTLFRFMIADIQFYQLALTTAINIFLLLYRTYTEFGMIYKDLLQFTFLLVNIYFFLVFLYQRYEQIKISKENFLTKFKINKIQQKDEEYQRIIVSKALYK